MRKQNSIISRSDQHALDAFLVDNQELEELTAKLSRFNIFHVLKAEKNELRHSNVLSWLLDPSENHGLDDKFLRRFISRLLLENDTVDVLLKPAQVELMTLQDIDVAREWKNIDVLVRSDKNKFCLLIENKIGMRESKGQLLRYKTLVEKEYPGYQVIPVLLSIDGDEPSDEGQEAGFVGLSHIHVLELLAKLLEQYSSLLPEDVRIMLEHYANTLRRLTMQDDELVSLCKAIYRKHREAIDLVVQYGETNNVLDSCEETIRKTSDIDFTQVAGRRVWFLPKSMIKPQHEVQPGWKRLKTNLPVLWWVTHAKKRQKLQMTMEVSPISNSDLRIRLLTAIREAGFKVGDKGFREESKFTRIYTLTKAIRTADDGEPDDDSEYTAGLVDSMWEKAWKDTSRIVDVLSKFKW